METERAIIKQLDANKKSILEAQNSMDKMAALRGKLHIRPGAGQRYLQKLKPDQSSLMQAEKEIVAQYGSGSTGTKAKSGKKTNILRNIARRGMA